MRVLVATEDSGSIKQVDCAYKTDTSKQTAPQPEAIESFAEQGRKACVDQLVVNEHGVVVARRNGVVELYTTEFGLIHTWGEAKQDAARVVALVNGDGYVVSCNAKGEITKHDLTTPFDAKTVQYKTDKEVYMFQKSRFSDDVYSVGGKELDLDVISLDFEQQTYKSTFKGKNVKNDKLDMPVPIWIRSMVFLDDTRFVTGTHYGQLRIYDTKKGRRPQHDVKVSPKPVVLLQQKSETTVIYSDNHMTTEEYSVREQRSVGKFAGATGAVQDMHVTENLVATGGLDRYLRVFDRSSRDILAKVFIGAEVNAVWVVDDNDLKRKTEEEAEEDELWDELKDKPRKKQKTK